MHLSTAYLHDATSHRLPPRTSPALLSLLSFHAAGSRLIKPQPVYVGHIPAGVLWSVSAACLCYLPTFTVCLLQGKTFSVSYKVTWLPDTAGEPSGQQTSRGWARVWIKRNKSVYDAWLINDCKRLREPECGNGKARTRGKRKMCSTASWKATRLKIVPGSWKEYTSRNVLTILQKRLKIEIWKFRASGKKGWG